MTTNHDAMREEALIFLESNYPTQRTKAVRDAVERELRECFDQEFNQAVADAVLAELFPRLVA